MKLEKSLAELDAFADEMLAKSKAAEKDEDADDNDNEVTPEEVSEDATPTSNSEDAENAETDEETPEKNPEKKEDNVEKSCNDSDLTKSDNADEDETEEEPEEDEDEETPEDVEKSIKDDFESDETVKKGMENSEFYAAVVDIFAKSLGDMQYDVQSQGKAQAAATGILAKSLQAMMQANRTLQSDNERLTRRLNKLEKSMNKGFEQIMDSLDVMSSQPAHMRKSMASVSVHDRDFDSSLNGQKTIGGFESLSKSQVLTVLNNELYSGNPNVTPQDIISYESGAPLRHDLQSFVASKFK